MRIRPWTASDFDAVLAAERACFADPWTESMLAEECRRADFFGFVAEEESGLVGYVAATQLFEDGEIPKIAVLPAFRGRGCGKALLAAAFAELRARGAERVFLEVREGNVPAVRLYTGCGFQVLRVRRRYYADGENALEMRKAL